MVEVEDVVSIAGMKTINLMHQFDASPDLWRVYWSCCTDLYASFSEVNWLAFAITFVWSCSLCKPQISLSLIWKGWRSLWHPGELNSQSGETDLNHTTKSLIGWLTNWNKELTVSRISFFGHYVFQSRYVGNSLQSKQRSQGLCWQRFFGWCHHKHCRAGHTTGSLVSWWFIWR